MARLVFPDDSEVARWSEELFAELLPLLKADWAPLDAWLCVSQCRLGLHMRDQPENAYAVMRAIEYLVDKQALQIGAVSDSFEVQDIRWERWIELKTRIEHDVALDATHGYGIWTNLLHVSA